MSYRYPKHVPVLTADDICKGSLRDNGHSCILGWLGVTFLRINREDLGQKVFETEIWWALPEAVRDAARHQSVRRSQLPFCTTSVVQMNDSKRTSLADVAAWFNRITAELGYTENNPEAKNVKGKP